jgi:signal transduction histidine kinase
MTAPLKPTITNVEQLQTQVEELQTAVLAANAQKELMANLLLQVGQSAHALDSTLQKTLEISARLTGAERGSIFLIDDNQTTVKAILIRDGVSDVQRQQLVNRVMHGGLAGWVVQHRTIGRIDDTLNDERWMTLPNQPYAARSALAVPILREEQLLGLLTLIHSVPGQFTADHAHLMQATASQVALVLDNAQLYARLQRINDELEDRVRVRTAELAQAYEQVHAAQERLQALSQQLLSAQEVERRNIARELHDEIGQSLSALKINLQGLQRRREAAELTNQIEDAVSIAERVLQQVRTLSLDLRPSLLDDMGLEIALGWYLNRLAERAGWKTNLVADLTVERLPTEIETVCFRVVQESLTNVLRHAQASEVKVTLTQHETELELVIHDNGLGFDVAAARQKAIRGGSLGLLGIPERVNLIGGRVSIQSSPNQGTEIRAILPLNPANQRTNI